MGKVNKLLALVSIASTAMLAYVAYTKYKDERFLHELGETDFGDGEDDADNEDGDYLGDPGIYDDYLDDLGMYDKDDFYDNTADELQETDGSDELREEAESCYSDVSEDNLEWEEDPGLQ